MNHKIDKHGLLILIAVTAGFTAISASVRPMMSIDLGSEYIKIAVVKPRVGMEIVLNEESNRKTRAIVAFQNEERYFAGQAENTALKHPGKVVGFLMQVLGRQFDDPQVALYRQRFPYYNLLEDEERGTVLFKIDNSTVYSPEEILAMLLEKAREYVNHFTKKEIKDAVLTVPPFYNQAERRAVQTAARLAGINLLQIISHNTAVALNFGVFRQDGFDTSTKYYMFYDMGSTSTVVTIVGYKIVNTRVKTGVISTPRLKIVGVGFDRTLGGLEFTLRLRTHLAAIFNSQEMTTIKVEDNDKAMAKLWKEAERVKKVLSANVNHQAQVENLLVDKDFRTLVTRANFEEMCQDLFDRITLPIDEALGVSRLNLSRITDVILMGGGTRMPKVQELLMKYLGRSELGKSINTDEAAAMGAVYKAASFSKIVKVKDFIIQDANIYPISIVYEKSVADEEGNIKSVTTRHVLYERMCLYPQKKVMSFINHTKNFSFNLTYSDLRFLSDSDKKLFGSLAISEYSLIGVEEALSKLADQTDISGVQAYFQMNESGILILDRITSLGENDDLTVGTLQSTWPKESSTYVSGSKEEPAVDEAHEDDNISEDDSKVNEESTTSEADVDADVEEKEADERLAEEEEEQLFGNDKTHTEDRDKESTDTKDKTDSEADVTIPKEPQLPKNSFSEGVNVTEFISVQWVILDVKDMSEERIEAAKDRLEELRRSDKSRSELAEAKNDLESFIIDYTTKLSNGPHLECSTELERKDVLEILNMTAIWFYEQSANATAKDFTRKLKVLKSRSKNITKRAYEFVKRPELVDRLYKTLELTSSILEYSKNLSHTPRAPVTKARIISLEAMVNETQEWIDQKVEAQQTLKPYENPVLLTSHIVKKLKKLGKELIYIQKQFQTMTVPESTQNTAAEANATKPDLPKKKSALPKKKKRVKSEL